MNEQERDAMYPYRIQIVDGNPIRARRADVKANGWLYVYGLENQPENRCLIFPPQRVWQVDRLENLGLD